MVQSLPKQRGFKSLHGRPATINVSHLDKLAESIVTPKVLMKYGLVGAATMPVKVLSGGTISRAVQVKGCMVSASAREKILAAGGSVAA